MSKRLESLGSNPTLRNYIQGAAQQAVSAVARFIAPIVPVAKMVGKYKKWKDKTRLAIPDTRRGLGSEGALVGFEMEDGNYNCEAHAINTGVDFVEEDEQDVVENLVKEGAGMASNLGAMAHEKRVLTAALAGATPGTTLDTTDSNAKLIDIINGHLLDVIKGAKGWGDTLELRVLIGATALKGITGHASILARYKQQSKGGGFISPTLDDIAAMFMLPNVKARVSLMVNDTAINEDAADIQFLLGSKLLIFAAKDTPDRYDPSFMKTFSKMGELMVPRYWQSASGRQQYAGFDWSEDIQVTNAGASRLCDVTVG